MNCTHCKGAGTLTSQGFTSLEGKEYQSRTYACPSCDGRGMFPEVDVTGIVSLLIAGKGAKGRFRASWPSKLSPWRVKDPTTRRAYYVWRLARFHGGADVTLPVTAMGVIAGDPFAKELDHMADVVAKRAFGTDRAALARWGSLMGFSNAQSEPGLPATAYEGGPVADAHKPSWEALELK